MGRSKGQVPNQTRRKMEDADLGGVPSILHGPSVAALTLRTRAIYFLPSEYEFVTIEIRVGDRKDVWSTEKVPVHHGTAHVDFWARIPTSAVGAQTRVRLKVWF